MTLKSKVKSNLRIFFAIIDVIITVSKFPCTLDHLIGLLPLHWGRINLMKEYMSFFSMVCRDRHRLSTLLLDLHQVDLLCYIPDKSRSGKQAAQ